MATLGVKVEGAKLVSHDDGLALLLDAAVLRELGIDEHTPVLVTVDGTSIRITPATRKPSVDEMNESMKQVNDEWGDVLKKLAE